jgi:GT2 family glycosyltransferase
VTGRRVTVVVMVRNWNGEALLARLLPSVLAAADSAGADVWVLDNGSDDGSVELCRTRFPSVRVETMRRNVSYVACNVAARQSEHSVFVPIDNDVAPEEGFLPPLLEHFARRRDVFAVTSHIRNGSPERSAADQHEATEVVWTRGMLRRGPPLPPQETAATFYNCGCATAIDREKFLALGGYSDLYLPLYYDDVDLSWRAWKRGWTCLYEPRSVVHHLGGSTVGRSDEVRALIYRNEFLFHWANLTTPAYVATHLALLGPRLLGAAVKRDRARVRGFVEACERVPLALALRRSLNGRMLYGDREVVRRLRAAR